MFELQIDTTKFEEQAKNFEGATERLPEIFSEWLNTAAFKTRRVLTEVTWPSNVTVRSSSFINAALRVEPAAPGNLRVSIYDSIGRANLYLHAKGGTSYPRQSRMFAIPMPNVITRRARGIKLRQSPKELMEGIWNGVVRVGLNSFMI